MSQGCAISRGSNESGIFGSVAAVFAVMEALQLPLREPTPHPGTEVRSFSSDGVVIVRDGIAHVYIVPVHGPRSSVVRRLMSA